MELDELGLSGNISSMKPPESTKTTQDTQVHRDTWLCRVGGADQRNLVKKNTQLHINRGSPYQKQRDLSSQPTSSGTGRGERGFRKSMLHGRKGTAKSFITVITTWAHLLFHSAGGGKKRKGGEARLNRGVNHIVGNNLFFLQVMSIQNTHTSKRPQT